MVSNTILILKLTNYSILFFSKLILSLLWHGGSVRYFRDFVKWAIVLSNYALPLTCLTWVKILHLEMVLLCFMPLSIDIGFTVSLSLKEGGYFTTLFLLWCLRTVVLKIWTDRFCFWILNLNLDFTFLWRSNRVAFWFLSVIEWQWVFCRRLVVYDHQTRIFL